MRKSFAHLIALLTVSIISPPSQAQTTLSPVLPDTLANYANPPLPDHFSAANVRSIDTTPANNPITDAGATLGRVLFYEKKLSINNTISCASCHNQSRGFSDQSRLSIGFDGGLTSRHSMGLSNARYYNPNRFFWDERANSLESQTLQPIQDSVEMGETLDNVIAKLSASDDYPSLFQNAFGSSEINRQGIANSLAQFIRSMISYRSKFDLGVTNDFSNFTLQEQRGRQLFNSQQTRCSACHNTDLQILDRARNNGLDATNLDLGAGNGRFKSPSLRNVAVRAPFMHDGRFNNLEDVINFYNSGVQNNPNLDTRLMRNGQPVLMNLNAQDRAALVAFLNTLTDFDFLNDASFSDPFELVNTEDAGTGTSQISMLAITPILTLLLSEDDNE